MGQGDACDSTSCTRCVTGLIGRLTQTRVSPGQARMVGTMGPTATGGHVDLPDPNPNLTLTIYTRGQVDPPRTSRFYGRRGLRLCITIKTSVSILGIVVIIAKVVARRLPDTQRTPPPARRSVVG